MVNETVLLGNIWCVWKPLPIPGSRELLILSILTLQECEINDLADSCVIEPTIICAFSPDPRLHLYFTANLFTCLSPQRL